MLGAFNPGIWAGSAISYDPDAAAYFAAMAVQPTDARKALINTLIVGLKADGLWSLLDCLWLIASHDAQAGRLNAKAPAAFPLTAVSSPSFVTDRGYMCDGTGPYLSSTFNYASSGTFSQNSAHISAHVNLSSAASSAGASSVGSAGGAASLSLRPYRTAPAVGGTINNTAVVDGPAVSSAVGFRLASRVSSTQIVLRADGASSTATSASVASLNDTLTLMYRGGTLLNGRVAQASVGAALSDSQGAAFYSRLSTYLTAIGAA